MLHSLALSSTTTPILPCLTRKVGTHSCPYTVTDFLGVSVLIGFESSSLFIMPAFWMTTAICSLILPAVGLGIIKQHWAALLGLRDSKHSLDFSPNELSASDITLLICLFVARALMIKLGIRPGIGSTVTHAQKARADLTQVSQPLQLPSYTLRMPLRLSRVDFKRYLSALEASSGPSSSRLAHDSTPRAMEILGDPAHTCLFFSAISEPAFLILLSQHDCPIQPLGAVNVRNQFELLDESIARKVVASGIQLDSKDMNVSVRARFLPGARVVRRGIEIDIAVSLVAVEEQANTEGVEFFRQTFTVLEFMRWPKGVDTAHLGTATSTASGTGLKRPTPVIHPTVPAQQSSYRMTSKDPGLWAALCLDYNPIHHVRVAARLAGFAGRLAHGNHVAARAIATTGISAREREFLQPESQRFSLNVAFKRPVVVPSSLEVHCGASKQDETLIQVDVYSSDKLCVEILMGYGST